MQKYKKRRKKICSAGRARPFPPHCCRGMRPEKLLGRSSGRKAQPVRRGGVSAENRHFIQQHGDQLFFNPGPAHRAVHGGRQQTNRLVTQFLWSLSEPRLIITCVANSQIHRQKSSSSDFSFFNVDGFFFSESLLIVDKKKGICERITLNFGRSTFFFFKPVKCWQFKFLQTTDAFTRVHVLYQVHINRLCPHFWSEGFQATDHSSRLCYNICNPLDFIADFWKLF